MTAVYGDLELDVDTYLDESGTYGTALHHDIPYATVYQKPGVFTVKGVDVYGGGFVEVLRGGKAIGTVVGYLGEQHIAGVSVNTVVESGGAEWIEGGVGRGATLMSGGYQFVEGGTAIGALVEGGGFQYADGGLTSGTAVESGGHQFVDGGTAIGTLVKGGFQYARDGVTSGTVVESGGEEIVGPRFGGDTPVASGTVVMGGGAQYVSSGGAASGAVLSGGSEFVSSGGVASGTRVGSGGQENLIGGKSFGDIVLGGGTETVSSGGVASDTVLSGGSELVFAGGVASGTLVENGGQEYLSGGTALAGTVFSGGVVTVLSGGLDRGGQIQSGGAEIVSAGGVASGVTVSAGVTLTVASGGAASGGTVTSGGRESVTSGGAVSALTVSSGGVLALSGGAVVGGLTVTAGGTIDLQGVQATSATWNNDTLAVSLAGGGEEDIGFSAKNQQSTFDISSDGSGGADIQLGPTELDLARICALTMQPAASLGGAPVDGFRFLTAGAEPSDGFGADAFIDTTTKQLVVAFRGTVPATAQNIFADGSWVTGHPTAALNDDVAQASIFLSTLEATHPGYAFTLTGHSLGGGIAQILASVTNLPTAGFDAPGSAGLVSQLSAELTPLAGVKFTDFGADINISLAGDQVTLAGSPIGAQFTIPSTLPGFDPNNPLQVLRTPFRAITSTTSYSN